MADEIQGHTDMINRNNIISDFFIDVEWKTFFNSFFIWSDKIGVVKFFALEGKHSDFEIILENKIRSKVENRGIKIRERRAVIKSSHSRAKREIQNLEDFSGEVWDKIDDILRFEFTKWNGRELIITVEFKAVIMIDKRSYILVNSSPPPSEMSSSPYKRERKTRTVNLRG